MMIKRLFFIILLLLFSGIRSISALSPTSDYVINNFDSTITINKDTSLTVIETISVNFNIPKHGIYRTIPYLYTNGNQQINSKLKVNEVLLDNQPVNFAINNYNQSKQIKIGESARIITGLHEYKITYQVNNVLQRYSDYDELYWNVTGHEWDTIIEKAVVSVTSIFAKPTKIGCFAGTTGDKVRPCQSNLTNNSVQSSSDITINPGQDFTIVIGLDKNNQLGFPGPTELLLQKYF